MATIKCQLRLLITVVFLLHVGQMNGQYRICTTPGCVVQPACQVAERVECNFRYKSTIELHGDDFPKLVKHIKINNVHHLIVEENAIRDLTDLETFILQDMKTIEVRKNGLARKKRSKLHELTIKTVNSSCEIQPGAVSGDWNSGTNIVITGISMLRLLPKALNHTASSNPPNMLITSVSSLHLDSEWQAAKLGFLRLEHVDVPSCKKNSLGGQTSSIDIYNAKIHVLKTGCIFTRERTVKRIAFRLSVIITIKPLAVKGTATELIIDECEIKLICNKGFQINVNKTRVTKSHFGVLSKSGLSINADISVLLEDVQIEHLKTNAFLGLKTVKSKGDFTPLDINGIKVKKAEQGSLRFAECQKVIIQDLNIISPRPNVCSVEAWTRELMGISKNDFFTRVAMNVFYNLLKGNNCSKSNYTKHPDYSPNPYCFKDTDGDTRHRESKVIKQDHVAKITSNKAPEHFFRTGSDPALSMTETGQKYLGVGNAASERTNPELNKFFTRSTKTAYGTSFPVQAYSSTAYRSKVTTAGQITKPFRGTSANSMTHTKQAIYPYTSGNIYNYPTEEYQQATLDSDTLTSITEAKKDITWNNGFVTPTSPSNDEHSNTSNTMIPIFQTLIIICAIGIFVMLVMFYYFRKIIFGHNSGNCRQSSSEVSVKHSQSLQGSSPRIRHTSMSVPGCASTTGEEHSTKVPSSEPLVHNPAPSSMSSMNNTDDLAGAESEHLYESID